MVAEIKSLESFKEIISSGTPVVIDFWATWCGPCRMISPVFEKMAGKEEFSGVKFYKCDTEDQPDVMQECGIQVLPTFLLFQNGNKIGEAKGAVPANLQKLIEQGASLVSASTTESAPKGDESVHTSTHEAGAPGSVMAESSAPTDSGADGSASSGF